MEKHGSSDAVSAPQGADGLRWITRRRLIKAAASGLALGAGAGFYAWRIEPHWLEVVERKLPVERLPRDWEGARLVQMSDLHMGARVDDDYLRRCFARVDELEPEVVVYTGDFVDRDAHSVDHARRMFPELPRGSRATFGVLGNHDYGFRWAESLFADQIAEIANAAGVRILRNEVGEVNGFHVVGLDDLWARRFDPEAGLGALGEGAAAVALSHNPDTVDLPGWGSYSGWVLTGHTHGGQCKPPFLPPPLLPVTNRRYTSGAFELASNRRMYINRGLGHLLRVRFNVRPEATVFELVRA